MINWYHLKCIYHLHLLVLQFTLLDVQLQLGVCEYSQGKLEKCRCSQLVFPLCNAVIVWNLLRFLSN